jgi:hypothetical protein
MEFLKKLEKSVKTYPKESSLQAYYDYKFLLDFYRVENAYTGQGFFTQCFLEKLCDNLNSDRAQMIMKALRITPRFDECGEAIICRFQLPYNKELRKAAMAFFFDSIYNESTSLYTEKVICDDIYFIMVCKKIS